METFFNESPQKEQEPLNVIILANNNLFSNWLKNFVDQCKLLFPHIQCCIQKTKGQYTMPQGTNPENALVFIDDYYLLDSYNKNLQHKNEPSDFVLLLNKHFNGEDVARIRSSIAKKSLNLKRHIAIHKSSLDAIRKEVIDLIKEKLKPNER